MKAPIVVLHVGNDPSAGGGIASVIRNYLSWDWGEEVRLEALPSYRPGAALAGVLLAGRAALALLRRRDRSSVVHVHLSQRGSYLREGGLLCLAALLGYRTCATVHGSTFWAFTQQHRKLVVAVLRAAGSIFVLSTELERKLHNELGLPQATFLPNAVPLPSAPLPPAAAQPPIALMAGELSARKGVDVLLSAWPSVVERVPGAELWLAGPAAAPLPDPLPTGVIALGAIRPDEVLERLGRVRCAVLPSRAEGMPVFLLEAMAHARPVVSTPVGGIPDLVDDAVGHLVPVGEVAQLAEALVDLLGVDGDATYLGRAAQERVAERFVPSRVVRQLVRHYLRDQH